METTVQDLLNNLPGMLYKCKNDKDWTMDFVSDGCKNLTEYEKNELLNNNVIAYGDLINSEFIDLVADGVESALEERRSFSFEYQITTKSGVQKWVWEQGIGLYDNNNQLVDIEGFITDITDQKMETLKLQQDIDKKDKELLINLSLLNEYKKAVDASAIVTKTTKKGVITYANDEFCKVTGYNKKEIIGKSHNIVRHPSMERGFFKELWGTILNRGIWKGVIKNLAKDGSTYYVKSTIVPILGYDGDIKEFIAIRSNVTDLIEQEQKIKAQTTDPLTQLSNRQKLIEDLEEDIGNKLAIINISNFREINEYYSFEAGDKLILAVSKAILKELNKYKLNLYKLTGGEFAISSTIEIDKDTFISAVKALMKVLNNEKFQIDDNTLNIDTFAGVTMKKNYFQNVKIALNYAKEQRKDLVFFDENLNIKEQIQDNINWTNKIKEALAEDRIAVFAQPIVHNNGSSTKKFECLTRFIETDGTVVSPAIFLHIAKKSKLYSEITRTVISKSFEYFKDKNDNFSINLTLDDITNSETMNFLVEKLNQYEGIGNRVILEIVEDEGIEEYDEVNTFIENMKFLGCRIAIDDFGTGYSNFDYLMKLSVDFIKIDGSIIRNIDYDPNAKVVTELIISFAKRLNIKTIGEYVHSESVLQTVKEMGIDFSQGYHLGEPKSIS